MPTRAEEAPKSEPKRQRPWYDGLEGSLRELDGLNDSVDEQLRGAPVNDDLSGRRYEPLDGETFGKLGRRVFEEGVDALAFYKSYHLLMSPPFPGQWGIFLLEVGVRYIADELQQAYPNRFNRDVALRITQRFLHRHERFHFRTDAWTISKEAATKQPLYYEYLFQVYRRLAPGPDCVEESLANCHAFHALRNLKIDEWMKAFMSAQPGAYANFRFDLPGGRELAVAKLAMQITSGVAWSSQNPNDYLFHAPFIGQGRYLSDDVHCPVWEVRVSNLASLLAPLLQLPDTNEFRYFVVRYLSGRQNRNTDHEKFRIDNGQVVRIPNPHRGENRLRIYELSGTLRKAGMQNWEYGEERRRTEIWRKDVPRSVAKPPLS